MPPTQAAFVYAQKLWGTVEIYAPSCYTIYMKPLVEHPRAHYDYEITDTYTAGVSLLGTEVASLKQKHGKLLGAFVKIVHGVPLLLGAHIPPFQEANKPNGYDPLRERKLLLTQKELHTLERALHEKGFTLIPLKLFQAGKLIKLEIGLGRGKKNYDKREAIKKRDTERINSRLLV